MPPHRWRDRGLTDLLGADTVEIITDRLPSVMRDKCGTSAGYYAHQKHRENTCQRCRNAITLKQAAQRALNPEHFFQKGVEYRTKNAKKIKDHKKRYYLENLEKSREKKRLSARAHRDTTARWRANNVDHRKAYAQKYTSDNPEHFRANARRRRALKSNVPSEPYTTQQILDLHGSDCHLCHEPIDLNAPRGTGRSKGWERGLHLEHVIPLSRGGTDLMENVRPSHGFCNLSKGSNTPRRHSGHISSKCLTFQLVTDGEVRLPS